MILVACVARGWKMAPSSSKSPQYNSNYYNMTTIPRALRARHHSVPCSFSPYEGENRCCPKLFNGEHSTPGCWANGASYFNYKFPPQRYMWDTEYFWAFSSELFWAFSSELFKICLLSWITTLLWNHFVPHVLPGQPELTCLPFPALPGVEFSA